MKRRNYNLKEKDRLQKVLQENKKLKRQISSLRKQIARIDLDRYHNIKEIINKYDKEEQDRLIQKEEDKIKKSWECFDCRRDYLRLIIITRRDGTYYYRACKTCSNRTKLKRYHENIKGPK